MRSSDQLRAQMQQQAAGGLQGAMADIYNALIAKPMQQQPMQPQHGMSR
jgi:hypothetical protein